MNPDSAELAILDTASELGPPFGAPAAGQRLTGPARAGPAPGSLPSGWLLRRYSELRADPARMAAVRDSFSALWMSRLLVWAAGVGTVVTFGFGPVRNAFNPPGRDPGLRVARRPAGRSGRALGRLLV